MMARQLLFLSFFYRSVYLSSPTTAVPAVFHKSLTSCNCPTQHRFFHLPAVVDATLKITIGTGKPLVRQSATQKAPRALQWDRNFSPPNAFTVVATSATQPMTLQQEKTKKKATQDTKRSSLTAKCLFSNSLMSEGTPIGGRFSS